MKTVPSPFARARARPLLALLCGVASIVAPMMLSAYVETLNLAVQRGEELRRVQRTGGPTAQQLESRGFEGRHDNGA